jgi:hypothetical protein
MEGKHAEVDVRRDKQKKKQTRVEMKWNVPQPAKLKLPIKALQRAHTTETPLPSLGKHGSKHASLLPCWFQLLGPGWTLQARARHAEAAVLAGKGLHVTASQSHKAHAD